MNDREAAEMCARLARAAKRLRVSSSHYVRSRSHRDMAIMLDAERAVDVLLETIAADPPENAQQELVSWLERRELPELPKPSPTEAAKRNSTIAKKEANRRYKAIVAGVLAEGFGEEEAKERAMRVKRAFLARCGL